ncbi:MBL fold metallo-hydrolase [Roseisolibacter agri]|uniref:Arylsulfatase n=1 Tax=Roseisolibacter agri TaxID=2014610 RepID=A0AA37QAY1_9BACT|nr:MBL fold metallo-hydrolase [Roseisolibacter agri]GLC26341.1 arylsulfatase [Roseisolibacter agri]
MRLTTIGTGTAAPSATRVQAGHLVEVAGVRLLLDCGSGVVHRMAGLGLAWQTLTHVAITHFHADHVSDLATLIVAWRYGQLAPRTEPITLVGPPGLRDLLTRHAAALWPSLLAPGFPVEVVELTPATPVALAEGVTLASHPVPHTPESVAYSVEHGGRRLVYTGDTAPDRALGDWAAGCDVLLAECSLPADMAVPTHLTPEQVGELAAAARPGLLALTHFYPPVEHVDVAAIVAARWTGPTVLAHDGWSVDVAALPRGATRTP